MTKGLYIKEVQGKGRAVFSRQFISMGEIIERCPVIVLPAEDFDTVLSSQLADYFFYFNKDENTLTLALGFGSLYNHALHPNANYLLEHEDRMMTYRAIEDIEPGTEICINYAGEPGKDYTEWFESRNITCKHN
jgi:uncharacterized protein